MKNSNISVGSKLNQSMTNISDAASSKGSGYFAKYIKKASPSEMVPSPNLQFTGDKLQQAAHLKKLSSMLISKKRDSFQPPGSISALVKPQAS